MPFHTSKLARVSKVKDDDDVQRITNAPKPLIEDQAHRMKVYMAQMAVRFVCLFLAVLIPGPLRWLFVIGAVILPYSAVLLANVGRDRREVQVELSPSRLIGAAPASSGAYPRPEAPASPHFAAPNYSDRDFPGSPDGPAHPYESET